MIVWLYAIVGSHVIIWWSLCWTTPWLSSTLFERASRVGKPGLINSQIGIYMALKNYLSDSSSPFTNMDMRNYHLIYGMDLINQHLIHGMGR